MSIDVDLVPISGIWWRQVASGAGLLVRRQPPGSGRWQRGENTEAVYLADSPDTAWAEMYRFLAEAAVPPRAAMPRDLAELSVRLDNVADLSDEKRLARVGLSPPRPSWSEWPEFQRVGEALRKKGAAGLIAPSAARIDGLVLCIFRDQEVIPGIKIRSVQKSIGDAPAPPTGLRT